MRIFYITADSALNVKFFFFSMKQQLKKTLKKFILHIVTVSIYTLMKRIRSNFIKKFC